MLAKTTDNSSLVGIIFLIILGVGALILIAFLIYNGVQNKKVEKSSPYLKALKEINEKYSFHTIRPKQDKKIFYLNSKRQYDNFDYPRKCDAYIKDNAYKYSLMVDKVESNKKKLAEYDREIEKAKELTTEETAASVKMKYKNYLKREYKLASKMHKKPDLSFSIYFGWEYTSPAGRNHYSRYCVYDYSNIKSLVFIRKYEAPKETYKPRVTPVSPIKPRTEQKTVTLDDIEDLD